MSWYYGGFRPYVPVAQRQAKARREMEKLRKKGKCISPIEIEGRKIASTFWGKGWCDHIEQFHDYENRLPRGRTYVRNGSVCHLAIEKGTVEAFVSGSELYRVKVEIQPLQGKKWKKIKTQCSGRIGSLIELLQGKFSSQVMQVVTDRQNGLFPLSKEIGFTCSCPDWAVMCKHVAAVLYGVGARLDEQPELLFLLRGVDHEELIAADAMAALQQATTSGGSGRQLADNDLAGVFGIDIDMGDDAEPVTTTNPPDNGKTVSLADTLSKIPPWTGGRKRRSSRSPKPATTGKKKKTTKKKTVKKSGPRKKAAPRKVVEPTALSPVPKKKPVKKKVSPKKKIAAKKTVATAQKTTKKKKTAKRKPSPSPKEKKPTKKKPVPKRSPRRKK